MSGVILAGVAILALIIAIPLLIYHFLVFPNVDGFINDLDFYNADSQSQHFLYWFWFWCVGFGFGVLGVSKVTLKA